MKHFLPLLLVSLLLGAPTLTALGATLSVEPPLGSAESTIELPVVFSADGESVNVVEGTITVPEGITIEAIDTSNSAFPLFASGPTYELGSRTIEFTAGAPLGINTDAVALVFVIHARSTFEGVYEFTSTASAYESDGSGTKIAVITNPAQLSVGAKGSVQVDALPKGAPQALVAEIGKDDSLFNGKWFVTFFGGSQGSPVEYYEVREGWWRTPKQADRYYVLEDQNLRTSIWVSAVDANGGRTTTYIGATYPWSERIALFAIAVLAGAIAFFLYRKLRHGR